MGSIPTVRNAYNENYINDPNQSYRYPNNTMQNQYPQPHNQQQQSQQFAAAPSSFNQRQNHQFDDDDDEEEEARYARQAGAITPEGYYEDIYGQYAQMDTNLHDSSEPYKSFSSGEVKDLNRNQSTSNRTDDTISSSTFGLWGKKRKQTNEQGETVNRTRHQRGIPSTALLSSPASQKFGWIPSTWAARLFILITLAEAGADISIEAVLLSRFKQQQGSISVNGGNLSALPVFLMVFGMAHVYQFFLAIDATVNRNTILVFGLVIFNLAFLVYALIQITEIRDVLGDGVIPGTSQTVPVQVLTGAIPVIIGCASLIMAILAFFLWKEFGWQIYKTIGADRRLKRAHLHFQVFVCLLKFDFFTFIAFCLQLVLVVLARDTPEFWITTFAPPVTMFLLIFAWYCIRVELKWGTIAFMFGLWGGAGYFSYKLFRIWQNRLGPYKDVYKSLTVFSVLALMLLLLTFLMTFRCMLNFDIGLKAAMTRSAQERKALKEEDLGSTNGHANNLGNGPVISSPFQYEMDSPYRNGGNGMSINRSKSGATVGVNGATRHRYNDSQDGEGYFEPYNQTLPYSQSTHGLLSPTKSPSGLMPVKTTSSNNLERLPSHSNHRLSLD